MTDPHQTPEGRPTGHPQPPRRPTRPTDQHSQRSAHHTSRPHDWKTAAAWSSHDSRPAHNYPHDQVPCPADTHPTPPTRPLTLEEAWLEIRGDRGEPFTDRLLRPKGRTWRPSSRGTDLIDLELDTELTPVPGYARPVWERWFAGPPDTPGAWAELETRQRGAWLDLVRERGCRIKHQDRPAGHAYELDGRHIADEPGLYLALGEAFNGPGGYFGGCLDALVDCLRGNFGYTAPATLLWRDAATAREHLSRLLAPEGEQYDLVTLVLEVLTEGGMHVTFT